MENVSHLVNEVRRFGWGGVTLIVAAAAVAPYARKFVDDGTHRYRMAEYDPI